MSKIPQLTHLQFLVLGVLRGGRQAGREIRGRLEAFGARPRGPAFYQLMTRLEDAGLVEGDYHQQIVEGQIIRERHYRITAGGSRAWTASRDFYLGAIRDLGGGESPARA